MLTDAEKRRIRAEEIFRAQVREELAASSSRGSRVWRFLNSAFGLWMLSALVLTGLGGAINWWQRSTEETEERLVQAEELNSEINCRFAVSLLRLQPLYSLPQRVFLAPGSKTGCLHDFSHMNLASLYEELARTLPSSAPRRGQLVASAGKAQRAHARWASKSLSEEEWAVFFRDLGGLAEARPSVLWILIGAEIERTSGNFELASEGLERAVSELEEGLPSNQSAPADAPEGRR